MTSVPKLSKNRLRVSSNPASPEMFRNAVDLFARKKENRGLGCFVLDGSDDIADDGNVPFSHYPLRLSSLTAYRICDKNDAVFCVGLNLHRRHSANALDSMRAFAEVLSTTDVRKLYLNVKCSFTGKPNVGDFGERYVEAGWNNEAGSRHYTFLLSDNNLPSDLSQRTSFFRRAVDLAGLADRIHVQFDGARLLIKSNSSSDLWITGADLKRYNPDGFRFSALESFAESWGCVDRVLACKEIVNRIDNLSLHLTMAPSVYESLWSQLNGFADEWEITFYGSYAQDVDPYTADASRSPDGRFPVLMWLPHDGNEFIQADIVATSEGRFLEIHSNCGDMKKLLKEAESATGLTFSPVRIPKS